MPTEPTDDELRAIFGDAAREPSKVGDFAKAQEDGLRAVFNAGRADAGIEPALNMTAAKLLRDRARKAESPTEVAAAIRALKEKP